MIFASLTHLCLPQLGQLLLQLLLDSSSLLSSAGSSLLQLLQLLGQLLSLRLAVCKQCVSLRLLGGGLLQL